MKTLTITNLSEKPWTSENKFDSYGSPQESPQTHTIQPPGDGGGGTTPGEPVIIDTYLPWFLALAVIIIILVKFLKKR